MVVCLGATHSTRSNHHTHLLRITTKMFSSALVILALSASALANVFVSSTGSNNEYVFDGGICRSPRPPLRQLSLVERKPPLAGKIPLTRPASRTLVSLLSLSTLAMPSSRCVKIVHLVFKERSIDLVRTRRAFNSSLIMWMSQPPPQSNSPPTPKSAPTATNTSFVLSRGT